MIRILQVTDGMNRGGLETLLINIHKNIDKSKIQFDYLIHEAEPQDYEQEILSLGGKIYRSKITGKHYFKYTRFIDEFFASHPEYKIIHGHFEEYSSVYLREAKKYGRITIAHSHSTRYLERRVKNFCWEMLNYPTRYIADYFIACSKKAGIARYGTNVKLKVLNNGVDTDRYIFSPDVRKNIREARNVEDRNTLVLGHVGRFAPVKNHSFLVKIFKVVHDRIPNSRLWLIGIGELEKDIRAQVHSLGIDDAVDFVGLVSNVNDYLMGMDIFVFTSLWEGFSLALLEAEACGLSCVVSEAIDDETIISDKVRRLNIRDKPEEWADEIISAGIKIEGRENYADMVRRAGCDIKKYSRELQEFYLSLI